ncbi:efflux RND transporter periplasmic adaptor subunit [Parvularcula maris]|uniref:HlyD family secretion protein n=1 Tax=Parvularcula maris TaxID=2965077 RepID=A0A9X2L6N2_9PROT|nr:HlyD family efflux transporter periplasmic adaptor subunit [Parvularcula maris]MCQ8184026.1 HlyD family secretion protein [Parvularcula maris]
MPLREQHLQYFTTLQSIRMPRVMRVTGSMIALTLTAALVFLTFTPWVQTTVGAGTVTTLDPNDRVQEINALVSGRIERWYVRDGARVEEGDPILKIADNDANLIERLNAEQRQLLNARDAAAAALSTARIDLQRTRDLFDSGLAARRTYEQARIRVEGLRSDLASAEAAIARQQVDLSRQAQQIVHAPRDGTILRINAGASSTTVSVGDPVATFQPEGAKRVVELYIDGRDVALVHPGSKVRLVFEGWPVVQFSGWPSIAFGTFPGEVLSVDPTAQANGQFRVLIAEPEETDEPWPSERFIRFGAKVRGWVLFETVPLGFELWRQLNNFPPTLTQQPSSGAQTR